LSWEQCLPLARESGFKGIDVPLDATVPADAYRSGLAQYDLTPGGASLRLPVNEDEAAFNERLAELPAFAARASAVGVTRITTWIASFSDNLPWKENFALHVRQLREVARILADNGCRLAMEFLGPRTIREGHRYPFISTLEPMIDLCDAVGPNAGLLLDSFHWYTSLGTVEQLHTLENRRVVYVHICDAPASVPIERQQDQVRCLPGDSGVIDFARFFGALQEIGYDGPVAPEPFDRELADLPPRETVARTARAVRRVWPSGRSSSLD
jgi:sugar phosphate isomerase/epimerase